MEKNFSNYSYFFHSLFNLLYSQLIMNTEIVTIDSFKQDLMKMHYKTLVNFMKDEESAKKFMSSVIYSIQKTPKLLECKKESLMNAFMTCAEFWMYPSSASWECYIIPYEKKKKEWNIWVTDYVEAQFQLGYQWIVTLLYRSWVQSIRSDIIRKNDEFSYINGQIFHKVDILKSAKDRGEAVGAYVIVKINWQEIAKAMNSEDILKFKSFSKSAGTSYSPWNISKDPELWMWIKTVLKQISKLLPKNEKLTKAIEKDNQDSTISDKKINEMSSDDVIAETLEWFEGGEEWENKDIS